MSAEDLRPHMDRLNESIAHIEKVLARSVDTFGKLTHEFVTDIRIVLRDVILPGHKYVLSSRCNVLAEIISAGADELDWTSYESSVGIALLRWFYTDEVVSANDTVTLGLLRAAHNFGLPTLFEACESKLLSSINDHCSPEFYEAAKEVNAKKIMETCVEWKSKFEEHSSPCQQLQIDEEDNLNSSSFSDIDLERSILISVSQREFCRLQSPLKSFSEELMELVRRKNEVCEGCTKLGKSMIGATKYMEFFDTTIWSWPAHKYFLARRSEKLQQGPASSGLKASYEFDLMRWLYTNHIHIESIDIALALLEASHKYGLHTLFVICEDALVQKISIDTCAQVHSIASTVSAVKVLNECERITAKYWVCIKSELNEIAAYADKSTDVTDVQETVCEFPLQNAEIEPATLLTLNDDCLLHLFRFLSLVGLGSVKDTCRRMSELADRSFQLCGDKSLKIRRGSMVADLWKLKHFGKLIKSLSLEGLYQQYCSWTDVLLMIGLFSTERLKSIHLGVNYNSGITLDSLKCLQRVVKNVEKIEFDSFNNGGLIESLLDHCANLSEVHIDYCEVLELNVSWCSKNRNIKSVTLKDLKNDDVLEKMCETLVHLESFSFNISVITDKLNHLCRLDHLKQLKIECYDENLNDGISSLLRKLAEKDILEYLSIMSTFVVEETARAICALSKLKELVFECVGSFENNTINILSEKLNTVEKLTFLHCDEITFEDIAKIITNKLDLKELTISGCESVDVIGRVYYLRLRKRRNLQIFLDEETFEKTMMICCLMI